MNWSFVLKFFDVLFNQVALQYSVHHKVKFVTFKTLFFATLISRDLAHIYTFIYDYRKPDNK